MAFPRLIYNSNQQMEFGQDWFWYLEQCWFPQQILNLPPLSDGVEYINQLLENVWIQGDYDRARFEIERIEKNLIDMDPFEKSLTSKLCAHLLMAMADREGVDEMMRQALMWMPSSYRHMVAVFTWLFGIVHWLRPARHPDAINEWKSAIKIITEISNNASLPLHHKSWYEDELVLMRNALQKAIKIDQLPPLGDFKDFLTCKNIPPRRKFGSAGPIFVVDGDDESPGSDSIALAVPNNISEDFFQLFVVYEEIPAGLPGAVGFNPSPLYPTGHTSLEPSDFIEVSRMVINNQEYAVKSLKKGQHRLSLISNNYYFMMRVTGHSMNQAGILDGDFVVIRSQMIAENGDIVVAEISQTQESVATLKRYSRRGKTITLKAESNSKYFSGAKGEWDFTEADQNKKGKFFIRGVAIAVLRPI